MYMSFNKGKIYAIKNSLGSVYIGSTTTTLKMRLSKHLTGYKRFLIGKSSFTTAYIVLMQGNCIIELLENVNCNTQLELWEKEKEYILKMECVNKNIPNRTSAEYYRDNIISITAKKSVRVLCGCCAWYRHDNRSHHITSKKHKDWIFLEKQHETELIKQEIENELKLKKIQLLKAKHTREMDELLGLFVSPNLFEVEHNSPISSNFEGCNGDNGLRFDSDF